MFKYMLSCMVMFTIMSLDAQVKNPCNPDSSYYSLLDSGRSYYFKSHYKYNERGQIISNTRYRFNIPAPQAQGSWKPNARFVYKYDPEGPLSEYHVFYWLDTGWKNDFAIFYDYNPSGKLISETTKVENAGKYDNFVKVDISYNASGKESLRELHIWDGSTLKWIHTTNIRHTFDDRNRTTSTVTSYWNNVDSIWDPGEKDSFIYTNGQLTEKIHSNRILDFWQKDARDIFEYDQTGRQTKKTHQFWDQNSWLNVDRELYYYTRKGCLTHTDLAFKWTDSTAWTNAIRDTLFYPGLFTKFSFYPNPANNVLYIEAPRELAFSLVDQTGRTVMEQKIFKGENEVDISLIAAGWYVVHALGYWGILVID